MTLSVRTCPTVDEASAALAAGRARYLGGGTLVVRNASEGDLSFDTLVRSTDPALSRIAVAGGEASLGAGVTMAAITRHPGLAAIAKAARAVGGPAIRNMATVGGNLFAAAPYGDFAVALMALGATVEAGGKALGIDDFLQVRDDIRTMVTGVRFPLPAAGAFRFVKVSRIKPKGVSVLSIAAVIETDAGGAVCSARVALGCMADRPIRARAAEAALVGATLTEAGVAKAVAAVSEGIRPITDPIASAWYRGEVLPVHFRRLLLA
ncbi:MAG: FAD binding domain-containing protein [Rhizobiales bacterium]|nr:FAD binding domain-containing protein [Hyphomicrobiales bacterium]MBN9010155.1 FAD binding domain-containing protein [Hyphomicrobiales bacterium]